MIEHIGNNSSRNTGYVAGHCAILDVAVGDFTVAIQTSGNSTDAGIVIHTFYGHVLHAKSGNGTSNDREYTYCQVLGCRLYLTIADDVTATVIVAFKALYAGSNRGKERTLHVDAVALLDVDFAVAGHADILIDRIQVVNTGHQEGLFLGAFSFQIRDGRR